MQFPAAQSLRQALTDSSAGHIEPVEIDVQASISDNIIFNLIKNLTIAKCENIFRTFCLIA